jgi:formamidopyrimidine-DNA glycosylase
MPELPEVETIKRGLELVLPGKTIERVDINYAGSIKAPSCEELARQMPGLTFTGAGRRGKYLLLCLDDNSLLVVHLRMTGRFFFSESEIETDKHTHLIIIFKDGSRLYFHDVRKFGTIWWLPVSRACEISGLAALGPEPLSADFDVSYFNSKTDTRSTNIKALLLDQTFVAGLGNIYVDEALHKSGILPTRPAKSLSTRERKKLITSVQEVLLDAISWRGTTFNDYRDAAGMSGQFQNRLSVYQRHHKPCPSCGTCICRTVVAGRGTHFCPSCQS